MCMPVSAVAGYAFACFSVWCYQDSDHNDTIVDLLLVAAPDGHLYELFCRNIDVVYDCGFT